ncbi:MAG: 4'-phosphopantetheinyl transferase superfamily protein [Alphaproteobacteria bacterium]|nr:4'-phosphopantetheinyl transferase superfamily protein [Alphaproteobacteria bacterium]
MALRHVVGEFSTRVLPVLEKDDVHVWLLPSPCPAPAMEALASVLSAQERARAKRLVMPEHRVRFTAFHGLTRYILSAYGADAPDALSFDLGPKGKPALAASDGTALSFNLSHSADLAVLAVSPEGELGVDIEAVRQIDQMQALARNTFAPAETAAILALSEAQQMEAFLTCWTRKEALIKADGRGMGVPLKAFEVAVDPAAPARLLRAKGNAKSLLQFELQDLPALPGYKGALAMSRPGCALKCFQLV